MSGPLVKVEGVAKKFCRDLRRSLWYGLRDLAGELRGKPLGGELREDEFWAVKDISFELRRGQCLGLIGRNGAGKTTLLRMLNGTVKPDRGRIELRGRVGALIALGAGFNPVLSGRENVYVNASVLGLTSREIGAKFDEIVRFAEIGEFIDAPVQSYSSGMAVRLGFAVATALEPDVLLLDEVLAVGDLEFRAKCFARMGSVLQNACVIFVSHSEAQVARICDQALLMEKGGRLFHGGTSEALKHYRQLMQTPATRAPVVLDPRVSGVELKSRSQAIEWNGRLTFTLAVSTTHPIPVDALLVHFSRNGEFVAHADLRREPGAPIDLPAGESELEISISPVSLAHGTYSISLSLFANRAKTSIVHALHLFPVEVHGPVGAGPATLLPITVSVTPVQ